MPGADLHLRDLGLQAGDDGVGGLVADRDDERDRHAALAARAVRRAHERADGVVDVRVGHDDGVVLRAAEGLDALAVRAALAIDVLCNRGRADEAERLHALVLEERVDRFLVAVDDV